MSLVNRIDEMLAYINNHACFTEHNHVLLDVYEGNLTEYIVEDMKKSLSIEYFSKVKNRLLPINILTRLIDKMSKVYSMDQVRDAGNDGDNELVSMYVDEFEFETKMNEADEYSNLHKGYAFEPIIIDGVPKLRVLPFDRFIVMDGDPRDPEKVEVFIKYLGEKPIEVKDNRYQDKTRVEMRNVYFAYTDEEFVAFDSGGDIYGPTQSQVDDFVNPIGRIPFYYGTRARNKILPTQDTDILAMTKTLPVILSDVSGAILFQCFTIIWGIDVNLEDASMSPNAFWELKSDNANADAKPQIGTLKPQVDSDKVLTFTKEFFAMWLETKGVKVGSIGTSQGESNLSGVAKIIDQADTIDLIKESIKEFEKDEKNIWDLIAYMHNYWVDIGELKGLGKFSNDFKVSVEFELPTPVVNRDEQVNTTLEEMRAGLLPPKEGIARLYPKLTEEQLNERVDYFLEFNSIDNGNNNEGDDGEMAES
jgi:hypothetical protein